LKIKAGLTIYRSKLRHSWGRNAANGILQLAPSYRATSRITPAHAKTEIKMQNPHITYI
jgi:hypothetical protein